MNKKTLAFPYVFWSAAFIVIPLCMVFYYGLTDDTGAFTFANIATIATAEHSKALLLSIELSLISTVICFLLAYPLAMILSAMKVGQHSFIVLIFILPMWMNFLLRTLAWQTLLEKTGVINSILAFLHLPALEIINTPAAIILGMVYNFLPFMVLPLYNALVKIDENVVNAARDLGANKVQTFLRITLPLSVPGIISGVTMVFIPALTTFVISTLLGGSKILLIGNVIEQEFTQTGNWHLGSGLSIVLMIFIIVNMVAGNRIMRSILRKCYIFLIFLFLYAPILTLIVLSFNASRTRAKWGGFTLKWYVSMFQNRAILQALSNTLLIALLSAFIATVIGTIACISMQAMKRRNRAVIMGITNIPMLNADIVTGISLMLLFITLGLRFGFLTILLSHITFNIPYVILSVMPRMKQLNPSVYEAALDLGASHIRAFFKVVFPDILPGVLSGFLMAFTMSLDDFIITHFTKGPGIDTLSTKIYTEVKKGIKPEMYSLSTLIFVTVLILLFLVNHSPSEHKQS